MVSRLRISRFSSRRRSCCAWLALHFDLLDLAIQVADFLDRALDFLRKLLPLQ